MTIRKVSIFVLLLAFIVTFGSSALAGSGECQQISSTITENVQFPEGWFLEWDWVNSAQTIVRDASATVYIIGGVGPFEWSVSGADFSLNNTSTQDRDNILNAGTNSCGSAFITVTDSRGDVAEGSVRNITPDTGYWKLYPDQCGLPGFTADEWYLTGVGEWVGSTTLGGKKQSHTIRLDYILHGGFATSAECMAAHTQNCGTFASPCMQMPDTLPGDYYQYCGEGTRKYHSADCAYYYGNWHYTENRLTDGYDLDYYQWECSQP